MSKKLRKNLTNYIQKAHLPKKKKKRQREGTTKKVIFQI